MARIRGFKRTNVDSDAINKLQDNLDEYFAPFQNSDIIDGILLTNIALTSGSTNLISHKLQREPLGWTITRQRASATIWDSQDTNIFKTKTLALEVSADVIVDLWIF
jgi:hypothetical protein